MGRWTEVLFVSMLVLSVVFARQTDTMVKQCQVSASSVAPPAVSNPVQSDILDVKPMPSNPLTVPSYIVPDFPAESFCIRFTQHQRRIVDLNNDDNCFLVKWGDAALLPYGRTGSVFIAPWLRSFDSFSPPGLIMRL